MAERGAASIGHGLARTLRERIARGVYAKGVPTESALMAEFGMSRYAVRSALQRLERDGLIERRAAAPRWCRARPTLRAGRSAPSRT
jgi:DNA-binding FadR family transcriptional regulator